MLWDIHIQPDDPTTLQPVHHVSHVESHLNVHLPDTCAVLLQPTGVCGKLLQLPCHQIPRHQWIGSTSGLCAWDSCAL